MLQILTTDEFAAWFALLADETAEDVATALDVIQELGPEEAPPGSRESLLWYEHPSVARFEGGASLAWDLEAWGVFHDYAEKLLAKLESPRFVERVARLGPREAAAVMRAVRGIRRATDPRVRWTLRLAGDPLSPKARPGDVCAEVRRLYFDALDAAGFVVTDVPAHSSALRELARRTPAPAFRILYGVDAARAVALVVLGERLDRSFYGDSVRRAEVMWRAFLAGTLQGETCERGNR